MKRRLLHELELGKQEMIQKALEITKMADEKGLTMRVLGATAFVIHCPKYRYLHDALGRKLTDIDFVAYRKQWKQIRELFKKGLGWKEPAAYLMAVVFRLIFFDPKNESLHSDIFFDKLEFCHDIPFQGRLEADYPTLPLAELLLEKLQIVKINEKDIIDSIMLIREHDVGNSDKETINADRIAKLFSGDWGFYYTGTTNLKRMIDEFLPTYAALSEEDRSNIRGKIDLLLEKIESEPKSMSWKMRAKVGPGRKWYRDAIEEVSRDLTEGGLGGYGEQKI
jgi:hypothetical protein